MSLRAGCRIVSSKNGLVTTMVHVAASRSSRQKRQVVQRDECVRTVGDDGLGLSGGQQYPASGEVGVVLLELVDVVALSIRAAVATEARATTATLWLVRWRAAPRSAQCVPHSHGHTGGYHSHLDPIPTRRRRASSAIRSG